MPIRKKKISDLTLADSLKGLYTIGYKVVGGVKTSVKVGLEYIQVAYEDVVKATQDAISAANKALTAASTADTSREAIEANELERENNESARKTSEQERAAAENQRATAETGRDNAEKARVTEFSKIKTDAEKATGDAISATGKTNEATQNANVATNAANAATAAANQAAIEANKSAENAEGKAQAAQVAAALAEKVAKHPPYVGKDHYFYVFDLATDTYNKTDIYTKGDAFSVSITYPSVAALEADVDNPEIEEGDFALVNTNDVENPDNAKIYVKVKNADGTFSYSFLVDMSGAIGFTGKTPQFSMGTISTLEAGSSATATVSEDGVDSDGNPRYRINFAIPRGNPGAPFNPVGQYDTLELLQAAIPDGSGVNGMIAVGTEAPYEYYAWLNGDWVNQGKIAGGGDGRMIIIPNDVIALTEQSSSAEIMNAFGSKDVFTDIVGSVENGAIAAINTPNGNIILPQIKAKANVYEDGEPKFDLTNFVFLGNLNSGANLVGYSSKTIKITDLAYCGIPLKDNVELGIDDVIKLNCKGGKQFDDGSWYFDLDIYTYYGGEEYYLLYNDGLGGGSQNTYFEFSLNIPAYHNGNKLQGLRFTDNSGPMDIEFNSADNATSNYSLSFTYLDPTSLNEGEEYSFYLENDVITLSKAGTGFGFVDVANILYKNNTTEYTPTGDYQPATKKYVDTSLSDNRGIGYMMTKTVIDATGLDENTWYPVVMSLGNVSTIRIEVISTIDISTKPSWSTHNKGFSVRKIWEVNGFGWGGNDSISRKIFVSNYRHAVSDPVRGVSQLNNSSDEFVFVRGGGKYHFYTSHNVTPVLYTDTYESGASDPQSVSPTTEEPALIVANMPTKEYVDNMNYGKVINGSAEILINCNLTGAEAEAKIATLFGSVDNFKQCVNDMIDNHAKYFYEYDNTVIAINGGAWRSTREVCELYFTFDVVNSNVVQNKKVILINSPFKAVIKDISTDDKLKTMFADITEYPEQNLNDINGAGIMSNLANANATPERNYPVQQAGTLFYGNAANGRANQIYGSYLTNRWFARGSGEGSHTSWREFAFKDESISLLDPPSGGVNIVGDLSSVKHSAFGWYNNSNGNSDNSYAPTNTAGFYIRIYDERVDGCTLFFPTYNEIGTMYILKDGEKTPVRIQ